MLNKTKEKKLDAIKSEILEITDFVKTNVNTKPSNVSKNSLHDEADDSTYTLTKIVEQETTDCVNKNINFIKNQLSDLKSTLLKHEKVLNEIVSKIN